MLVGLNVHVVLSVEKLTTPAKAFCAETVTVDVPALPAFTITVVGVRLIVKSWTVKVTVAECDNPALAPVVVRWIVEADAKEQDTVELPEPEMLAGDALQEVLFVARLTTPAKPLSPDTIMVEVTVDPAFPITVVAFTVSVKS